MSPGPTTARRKLDDNLTVRIQISDTDLATNPGTDCAPTGVGSFTDVAGASGTNMKTLINTSDTYGTGLPVPWGSVTAGTWRVARFAYTLAATTPVSAHNDSLKVTFTWEAQR